MDDLVQDFFIRPEGNTFDLDVYESYTNLFTIKCHYYGKFNDGPKKEYIEGETCFVDYVNRDQFTDVVLNSVINSLGYEMEDEVLYWFMDVYVEIVEKNEESESGSDSASESDNDFEDEEHVVQEVEVNMGYFNFQVEDASTGTDGNMIPVAPKVNLTEDNIEVLEFDSLESDLEDVPENDRRLGLRKLKKKHSSSKFYIGKEFANRDVAKDLIRTHAVESRRNLHFLRNDPIRIRVVCNGVVPCKNLVTYKVPGPNVDNAVKDTTVKIDVYGEEDPESPTRLFRRIYVCLGALKKGFREGGRELLGLDGAFMRGQYPGQMLTAVGVDANNGIYPVAYGIVESENQYSWTWFLKCLGDDFDLYSNSNFTFITDRQKGLLPALEKLFPHAEHRYCVRHIYENMNLTWKGSEYKEMLWKCASSTTTVMFEKNMQELKDFNKKAYEWLKQIPAEHWSRAYFSGRAHCDLLINNICEVFNRQLLEARDSPIITALEHVREYLMKRIVVVQKIIEKCDGPLTPAVARVFDIIKEASSECIVDWNGADQYQVHDSIQTATWKAVYSHKVNPVNGRELWSKFDCPTTLLPPKIHPQIGRPPKKRKKTGHNKRSCDRRQPSQGGTSNAAGVGTQPSEGETSNAAGVGPLASQGGTSNAAGVGTQSHKVEQSTTGWIKKENHKVSTGTE
ncbi:mutator type transposase [Tanacetum coccineum]